MKMKWIVVILLLMWMFDVANVLACVMCMFNQYNQYSYILPSIYFWCMWSVSWFLSMAILSTYTGQHFIFQPSAPIALVVVFLAYTLLFIFLGPLAALCLFLVPVLGVFQTLVQIIKKPSMARNRKGVLIIAIVHVFGFLHGNTLMTPILNARTEAYYAEKIVEWSGRHPSDLAFRRLRNTEPDSIEAYRYIVQHGSGRIVAVAAERLGSIGDPNQDLDILRIASGRAGGGDPKVSEAVDEAIKALEKRMGPDS
jgi:hypothetical protein